MKVAVFSDIHANLTAMQAVLAHCNARYGTAIPIIHLGDCVDYGMRPNETVAVLAGLQGRMPVNIRGNHEASLFGIESHRFSSPRGLASNEYTASILTEDTWAFIRSMTEGSAVCELAGKRILAVHGDMADIYWGKMKDDERRNPVYAEYDYVFCGHTHVSGLHCNVRKAQCANTLIINPGSIGQPRNCNPCAQYAVVELETGAVTFEAVPYDIAAEQALYHGEIDDYYRDRLSKGF